MTAKILFMVWKSSSVSPLFFPLCAFWQIFLGSCFSLTVKKRLNLMINLAGLIDRVVIFPLPPNMLLVL